MMVYGVIYEDEEIAVYPELIQAEIYADGFNTARRTFDDEDGTDAIVLAHEWVACDDPREVIVIMLER